jgi:hypothetical protein
MRRTCVTLVWLWSVAGVAPVEPQQYIISTYAGGARPICNPD